MQKPFGYDEAQASGDFTPVRCGGHYCIIKDVSEKKSKTDKDMIVVQFDFCDPDDQAGYFQKSFDEDFRAEKKWPFQGTRYLLVYDYRDPRRTSRDFKTFCSLVEKSNNYTIRWGCPDWGKQFVGKQVGAVFGEVESEYNGRIKVRPEIRYFCSIDRVKDIPIPESKMLHEDGFASVTEEELSSVPFWSN